MADDKTEKATPKRREEARKRGQVAKSTDLNGAIVLIAGLLALSLLAPHTRRRGRGRAARRAREHRRPARS